MGFRCVPARGDAKNGPMEAGTLENPVRSNTQRWLIRTFREAAWAPILVLLVYVVTAFILDLFQPFPQLDIPMHLAGGMATSFFLYRAMRIGARLGVLRNRKRTTVAMLVFGLTLVIALLWELAEYGSDRLYGTHEQLGPEDTITDILVGMMGSATLLTMVSSIPPKRRR